MSRSKSFFAALLIAGSSASALAQSQGTDDQRSACMGDAFRLCSGQIPDEDRIEKCLEASLPSLSPACRAQFDEPAPPVIVPPKVRRRQNP